MKPILNLIASGSFLAALAIAQTPGYTLTDLGPASNPFSQATFVAGNGAITGLSTVSGSQHAVVWQSGRMFDLATPGLGGPNSFAGSINELGQVLIQGELSSKDPNNENFCGYGDGLICLPYLWQFGVVTPLPTLGGNNASFNSMNKLGEVAGYAENSTRDPKCPSQPAANGTGPHVLDFEPVIWGPGQGQIRQLLLLPGDTVGLALWINDRGQAAGISGSCANTVVPGFTAGPHAVLWDSDGTVHDLGNLGGTSNPALLAVGNGALVVNNRGEVTGLSALKGNTTFHPFLWTQQTGIQDLGVLPGDLVGAGLGMNNKGVVVGASISAPGPAGGNPRAFLWQNGVMSDINALVPPNAALHLLTANAINDQGQIVWFGATASGEIHAFLATPSYLSSTGATTTSATNAVVTPVDLTTSQSSVVLDGSGSTSSSGNLSYVFTVLPGGNVPALLQTLTSPSATVEFVNGPGLYLLQLIVTDASGNSAKSQVIMLNYQPSAN